LTEQKCWRLIFFFSNIFSDAFAEVYTELKNRS